MICPHDLDGRVYVETRPFNTWTSTRWCEVLGEPGVSLTQRGEYIALALRILEELQRRPEMRAELMAAVALPEPSAFSARLIQKADAILDDLIHRNEAKSP